MDSKFEFDPWKALYSDRTASMKSSEVRDLLSVTARPDIISFAGGLPDTRCIPMQGVIEAAERVMQVEGPAALQYGTSEGLASLREQTTEVMESDGIKADAEDVILTNGSQQALELLAKIFINPNETIVVEAPSYVGALNAFCSYQARVEAVPLDNEGIDTELLEKTLSELKAQDRKPKFLYLVPSFHNPAGVTLSEERRLKVIELAKKHDVIIIEDNPYSQLRYEGLSKATLRSMYDNVIYLGTFSKILSPGFRVGWILAPKPIYEKLIFAKQAADLCSSSFSQKILSEYLEHNSWSSMLSTFITVYRQRRDTMLEAMRDFFPEECTWTEPHGGLFLWVTLPDYLDSTEMLAEAISEAKVAYVPGRAFYADGSGKKHMRFNFSFPDEESIYEGVKRLAKVIKKQMDLYKYLQP